jgi:nitroreductase
MDVKEAIRERRAYRSLEPADITEEFVRDLAECAQLFCSCFNNQPWRFVFAFDPDALARLRAALSKGNEWAHAASLIIAVFSKKELDCVVKGREYYLFDTGMATAAIVLRATELGLVAHAIAGFDEPKVKEALGIPDDMTVITLVIVGKHAATLSPVLSDKQREFELKRPDRLPLEKIAYMNRYSG